MSPAAIAGILALIQAALAAAPKVVAIVKSAKELVDSLFSDKLITVEQQKMMHDYVDNQAALIAGGVVPKHWQVEPDPEIPPPVS